MEQFYDVIIVGGGGRDFPDQVCKKGNDDCPGG